MRVLYFKVCGYVGFETDVHLVVAEDGLNLNRNPALLLTSVE